MQIRIRNSFLNKIGKHSRKSIKEEILEDLRDWSFQTTSHGIPHLMLAKRNYQKLIWLGLIFVAIGFCSFMVAKAIAQYLDFEALTKIYLKRENEIAFPVVSICNVNPFATPEANTYIQNYYNQRYNLNLKNYYDLTNAIKDGAVTRETNWLLYQSFDPNFNDTLRKSFGIPLETMLISCQFSFGNCSLDDFEWYYNPMYGNCYKFNSAFTEAELKKIYTEGSGLKIELLAGYPDSIYKYFYQKTYKGVAIVIEDQLTFPIQREGIFIQRGSHANIIIDKTVSRSLPSPYSDCVKRNRVNTLLSNEMKQLGMNYSHRNCLILCQQKQNIEELGCYNLQLPQILQAKPCSTKKYYDKLCKMEYDFTECYDLCPFECEKTTFGISISYADFPSYNYYTDSVLHNKKIFNSFFQTDNVTYEMLKESMVSFFIYFDELISTQIDESESWTLVDLVANIGGHLGLFVGISMLTFGELFVILLHALAISIRNCLTEKPPQINIDTTANVTNVTACVNSL